MLVQTYRRSLPITGGIVTGSVQVPTLGVARAVTGGVINPTDGTLLFPNIAEFGDPSTLAKFGNIGLYGNIVRLNAHPGGDLGTQFLLDVIGLTAATAEFKLWRASRTTGNVLFTICRGDFTGNIQHQLAANNALTSYLCADNGRLCVGASALSDTPMFGVQGKSTTQKTMTARMVANQTANIFELQAALGAALFAVSPGGALFLANGSTPTTPVGGISVFGEGDLLKVRTPDGTVRTVAFV